MLVFSCSIRFTKHVSFNFQILSWVGINFWSHNLKYVLHLSFRFSPYWLIMVFIPSYLKQHSEYASQGVNVEKFSFKTPRSLQQEYSKKRSPTPQTHSDDINGANVGMSMCMCMWILITYLRYAWKIFFCPYKYSQRYSYHSSNRQCI